MNADLKRSAPAAPGSYYGRWDSALLLFQNVSILLINKHFLGATQKEKLKHVKVSTRNICWMPDMYGHCIFAGFEPYLPQIATSERVH